jgi:hypothetical protein
LRQLDRPTGVMVVMNPANCFQVTGIKALNAQRKTIYASRSVCLEAIRFYRTWISLA